MTLHELIQGDRLVIALAHEKGLHIFGATLDPCTSPYCTPTERLREALNHFIRSSGAFDGVIDFEKAVRDPTHPERWRRGDASKDGIHPDDAGYRAMANAINLSLFRHP